MHHAKHTTPATARVVAEAEDDTRRLAVMLAALETARAQAGRSHSCTCQRTTPPARPRRSAGELAAVAAGLCACVGVATAALLAAAIAAVALGISATVLYLIWRQVLAERANRQQHQQQ